ncbi:MAG: hypothetical protein JW864_01005 [Spirochaetes bacterium]|nr:hypothetical protein [Spirochaetota bacterium]
MNDNGSKKQNRRRGPDTLVKSINVLAGVTWFLILVVFILITFAKPRVETFFDRQYNISLGGGWDKTIISYAVILLFILVMICFIGIIININRHKRKTDKYNKSLIWFGIISLIGMIYFLIIM